MRISRAWLSDYVDFDDLSEERFADLITTRVAEVDSVEQVALPMNYAQAARVLKVEPVPGKDKLRKVLIDLGSKQVVVVCGAPNCCEGMVTAYLAPGAQIYIGEGNKTAEISERAVGGIVSCGVLCSEAELGLSNDHSGIIDLSEEFSGQAGEYLKNAFGASDTVLDIDNKSLTHRPDLWCHWGFAKEIAAILGRPLKQNPDRWADNNEEGKKLLVELKGQGVSKYSTAIAPNTKCGRFLGLEFINCKTSRSPLWIRRRLSSVGGGVRNLLVDLSNYVMHDIGQPNHAYDADSLDGYMLTARNAQSGEKFLSLDGEERVLCDQDMVIADSAGACSLAGVMGGSEHSINDNTTHLYLESASFCPVAVRLTTKRQAIRTDASNRFEKSRSSYAAPLAIHRFAEILLALQPEAKIVGSISDACTDRPEPIIIKVSRDYIRERLGASVPDAEIDRILTGLKFVLSPVAGEPSAVLVEVPYERATRDVSMADDIVEEIGRIYGYENIPECAPTIVTTPTERLRMKEFEYAVRDCLSGEGYSEVYNYSFMDGERAKAYGYSEDGRIELKNAIDSTEKALSSSLVPNMIACAGRNARYQQELYLYEIARTYQTEFDPRHEKLVFRKQYQTNPICFERRMLCLAYSSGRPEESLELLSKPAVAKGGDFYALCGSLRNVCWLVSRKDVRIDVLTSKDSEFKEWMHPYRAASIYLNDVNLGIVAEVKPGIVENRKSRVVVAEIDLELLLEADDDFAVFRDIPKFPDSFFEMSVVVPEEIPYRELETLFKKNVDNSLLRKIEVLAVYRGKPLNEGEKSISVKFFFGADDRTLGREEIDGIQSRLITAVESGSFSLRR